MKPGARYIQSALLFGAAFVILSVPSISTAVVVRVQTVIGSFDINMQEDAAQQTVANFLNYVRDRDYDNSFIHRRATLATAGVNVIQGGGFTFANGSFGEVPKDAPIKNEFFLSNTRGNFAMARQPGNPDSATSQWFVNDTDNTGLNTIDGGFTVFGNVVDDDLPVIDAIGGDPAAIPGVNVTVINGQQTSPIAETPFAPALTQLPALNFDSGTGIPFDPNSNLVLITSVREVGADLLPDQTSLDFFQVLVGDSVQQSIDITNRGLEDLTLTVTPAPASDPVFSVSGNTCTGPIITDAICTITFAFAPQAAGNLFSGSFNISSNDSDTPDITIQMSGEATAVPEPRISLSPEDSLSISGVEVGSSMSAAIAVTNRGLAPLVINSLVFGGDGAGLFSQTNNCGSLEIMEGCTITVTFTPVAIAATTSILTIGSNDTRQPSVLLSLEGIGVKATVPDIDVTPSLNFDEIPVNAIDSKLIVVRNTGDRVLQSLAATFGGVDTGDFIFDNRCNIALDVGGTCIIRVVFRPRSEGAKSATVTVTSDDPDEPVVIVPVMGVSRGITTPLPDLLVTPQVWNFGGITVGQPTSVDILVTNPLGTGDLTISSISFTGTNAAEFSETNDCSVVVPVTGSCTITVTHASTSTGNKIANLVIVTNDPDTPTFAVLLNGVVNPVLDPDISLPESADFGEILIGSTATLQLQMSNQGSQDLLIQSIALSGTDAGNFAISDDCPGSLPPGTPGNTCNLTVAFTANTLGVKNAQLTVTTNDPDEGTVVIAVTGAGANDTDGVNEGIEDGHPNKNVDGRGDGNGDGIADALQSNVTSLPNIFGEYVTLVSSGNTRLVNVRAITNPLPSGMPIGIGTEIRFDQGFFQFSIEGVTDPVTVTYIFPPGASISNFFQIGPTPDRPAVHWFPFMFDGLVGAEIKGDRAIVHFVDGLTGDGDLAINGTIVDPGAPASIVPLPIAGQSGGGGSGCSVSAHVVSVQTAVDWLLVLIWLGLIRIRNTMKFTPSVWS